MNLSWRKRAAFLAALGVVVVVTAPRLLGRALPSRSPDVPDGAERHASTAILPAPLRRELEERLDPFRTRDFGWFRLRYGGADPGATFQVFNRQHWSRGVVVMHDGVWVSEPPPHDKPPDEVWIGAFGASSVEGGFGFDDDPRGRWNSWPLELERSLRRLGLRVRVFNYGFAGIFSGEAVWRFETEAIPTGIDVALFYAEHNDAAHCSLDFGPRTLAALDRYVNEGDVEVLRALHPWFLDHREGWARVRSRTLADMELRLGEAESELRSWLSRRSRARPGARAELDADPGLVHVPTAVLERLGEVESALAGGQTLAGWVARHPGVLTAVKYDLDRIRREDDGRRIAADPRGAAERAAGGVDAAAIAANMLHGLGDVPELASESETIRNLDYALEAARAAGVAAGIVAIPTGYRFHPMERGICGEFLLRGEDIVAYVEGALNPWQRQLAERRGVPYVDLQAVLHDRADPGPLFHDLVHLTFEGKTVATREALVPLALEVLERVGTPRRPAVPPSAPPADAAIHAGRG